MSYGVEFISVGGEQVLAEYSRESLLEEFDECILDEFNILSVHDSNGEFIYDTDVLESRNLPWDCVEILEDAVRSVLGGCHAH